MREAINKATRRHQANVAKQEKGKNMTMRRGREPLKKFGPSSGGGDDGDVKEDPINNNVDIGPANGLSLDQQPIKSWKEPAVRKSGGRRPPSVVNKDLRQRSKIESLGNPVEKEDFLSRK